MSVERTLHRLRCGSSASRRTEEPNTTKGRQVAGAHGEMLSIREYIAMQRYLEPSRLQRAHSSSGMLRITQGV